MALVILVFFAAIGLTVVVWSLGVIGNAVAMRHNRILRNRALAKMQRVVDLGERHPDSVPLSEPAVGSSAVVAVLIESPPKPTAGPAAPSAPLPSE